MRSGHVHRGPLAFAGVAAAGVVIRFHTDLVGPQDFGILAGCLCLDGRVGLFQPLVDLVGVLLARMPLGLLGRVPPRRRYWPTVRWARSMPNSLRIKSRTARRVHRA